MRMCMRSRRAIEACVVGAVLGVALPGSGCSAAGRPSAAGEAGSRGAAAAGAPAGGGTVVSPQELADVEQLLAARTLEPAESLAVRLVGSIGPNGSYALAGIEVEQSPGRIVLWPRVRRVAGDFFIQMVIPLDHTVRVALPAGRTRIEARGSGGVRTLEVVVQDGARREPPQAYVDVQVETAVGDTLITSLRVEGRVADGFVERLELREVGASGVGPWQAPEFVERTSAGLHGTHTLRRNPGDAERRIQARVCDGQGTWSPLVESILRAR